MKRVYLFLFIAIAAVVMIAICLINFDPRAESWASLVTGLATGLLIVKLPAIKAWINSKYQKSAR